MPVNKVSNVSDFDEYLTLNKVKSVCEMRIYYDLNCRDCTCRNYCEQHNLNKDIIFDLLYKENKNGD